MIIPEAKSQYHPMGDSKFISLASPVNGVSGLVYVQIPKNASCWIKKHFNGPSVDFNYYNGFDPAQHQVLVVLRDPFNRWISGFSQMISGDEPRSKMHVDNLCYDEIFEIVEYDNHTQKQVDFIANLPHENITWFKFEDDVIGNFIDYMSKYNLTIVPDTDGDDVESNLFNRTSLVSYRQNISTKIKKILDENPKYQQQIQDYYDQDYQLYNSVPYYTKTKNY
jgi:hypothetical protein